jgi:hypothetical protein
VGATGRFALLAIALTVLLAIAANAAYAEGQDQNGTGFTSWAVGVPED